MNKDKQKMKRTGNYMMVSDTLSDSEKVEKIKLILKKYNVCSAEHIAQSDSTYENAVEFMSEVADVVGWACPYDDEGDEE